MEEAERIKTAVYCRVSNRHEELAESLENQMRHYREVFEGNAGYELVQIYYDFGISGFCGNRKGFQQMLRDARENKFELIVTKSVIRFARNTQVMLEVVRELKRRGIGVLFELQRICTVPAHQLSFFKNANQGAFSTNLQNLTADGGELLLTLQAAFSQAESDGGRTRTKMAIRRKLTAGIANQRLSRVFGYSRCKDGCIFPDENAKTVKQVFEMAAKGSSISEIAAYLNENGVKTKRGRAFRRSTVFRMLQNEEYKGDFVQQRHFTDEQRRKRRNEGLLPMYYFEKCNVAIVSEELWNRVQEKMGWMDKLPERGELMAEKIRVIPAKPSAGGEKAKKKLRVAAYCRVSTEQEEQLGSFENQVEYYKRLIYSNPNYEMAGIFSDEGISGTGTKKRIGFQQMMKACRAGKIDQILTKSISRFARNTADCLRYSRELKELGVNLIFEKEGISIMDSSGELLFTILSALAQEESRNISQNTQWGIRSRFRQGIPHINTKRFMGYDKGEDGQLQINEAQAAVVRRIFREYLQGWELSDIARRLIRDNIAGVTGRCVWPSETIRKMLKNEKYKGDLLMQKYYTADFLTKRMEKNEGAYEQYYVKDAHPAIISDEEWTVVQLEMQWRQQFRERHGVREMGNVGECAFFGRVYCGKCGCRMIRKMSLQTGRMIWVCKGAEVKKRSTCDAERIDDEVIVKTFGRAWQRLCRFVGGLLYQTEEDDDARRCFYSRRRKEMLSKERECEEAARLLLEEMTVKDGQAAIVLKDGTTVDCGLWR